MLLSNSQFLKLALCNLSIILPKDTTKESAIASFRIESLDLKGSIHQEWSITFDHLQSGLPYLPTVPDYVELSRIFSMVPCTEALSRITMLCCHLTLLTCFSFLPVVMHSLQDTYSPIYSESGVVPWWCAVWVTYIGSYVAILVLFIWLPLDAGNQLLRMHQACPPARPPGHSVCLILRPSARYDGSIPGACRSRYTSFWPRPERIEK